MASVSVGPSAESLSQLSSHPQDMGFGGSLDASQSTMMTETTSRQLSPSRTMPKSPPRNGVPPKRLSMTAKRSTPPTTTASSRSNPPLASRSVSGTGLSKPPTRPSISSAVRRPATSVTAATAASTGHRKRPSIASNEINGIKRGDLSGGEENIRPTSGKPEARRNIYDKADVKNAMQISNADKPNSATKVEQGAASGRTGTISPTKSVLRSTTNSSRPTNIHSTPRGIRPTASSAGGVPKAESTKKRLSTIPASPAPVNPETSTLQPAIAPATSKATRPALHNRKSTISVTVEQRLKEIDLVHQMLRVAIAEDGEDDEEVKEEYGRKVDESLASLRIQLEEARSNERIEPQEREISKVSSEQSSEVDTQQGTRGDSRFLEALRESEDKVSMCPIKSTLVFKGLTSKLQVVAPSDDISDVRQRLREATSSIGNNAEGASRQSTSTDIQALLQEEIQRLRETQALRISKTSESHRVDLAAMQAERDATESRYQETADRLESEANAYALKLQTLEVDLAAEREKNTAAASRLEDLEFRNSALQSLQLDQRQRIIEINERLDEQADLLRKSEDMILEKDREIAELQVEMKELHTDQAYQLEEVEKTSLDRRNQLEDELSVLRADLSQLESSHQSVITSHKNELISKDEEIKGLAQVIEGFQTQVQSIHEQKEREINETKLGLIEEHENVVNDLQRQHRDETADMELSNEQKLQAMRAEHENALESARENYASKVEKLDELLRDLDVKNEMMEQEISNGKTFIEKLEVQVTSLEREKAEVGDAFKHASDEVMGLRKTLETLGHDAEDKDRQYAAAVKKLEDELAESTKALEERISERDATLKRHVEEIDSLHSLHAVNSKAMESESRDVLLELQKNHDKLIAQSMQTERDHEDELGALKSEHSETLEKRAKDLEDLITTHATETRDKLDQIERTHQEEIKALIQNTDQKYESLCKEMTVATEQLQQHEDSRGIQAERCEELVKVVESLKAELATSQDELSHANSEITKLTTEIEEARKTLQDTTESDHLRYEMFELTRQHAAEIARMQETLEVENEKRAKERKQGAEVRDRLVGETEKLAHDLSAAKSEADKYRTDLHLAKFELEEEVKKNVANCQSIELLKARHQEVTDDLKVAQADIEKMQSVLLQDRDEGESSHTSQELEALQMAADAERAQNAKLREQILEATVASERQATRLREVECALKVTSAQLVEAQTIRPKGSEFSASPVPKSGLRSSRWAIPDAVKQMDVEGVEDDENLGSTISGNVRSFRLDVRDVTILHIERSWNSLGGEMANTV